MLCCRGLHKEYTKGIWGSGGEKIWRVYEGFWHCCKGIKTHVLESAGWGGDPEAYLFIYENSEVRP